MLLVVIWAPSILLIHSISTWQLIINTLTTIITFLLVALLQNTQERSRPRDPGQAERDLVRAGEDGRQAGAHEGCHTACRGRPKDRESSDGK